MLNNDLHVGFSHVQLFVDSIESLEEYKTLEKALNEYHSAKAAGATSFDLEKDQALWRSVTKQDTPSAAFVPQGRDVIKQMMVGFGFRVTASRFPGQDEKANARSLLVTSKDVAGVQVLVTAPAPDVSGDSEDDHLHFDVGFHNQFLKAHSGRQGVGVLGFEASNVDLIREKYESMHPNLFHSYRQYNDGSKVLQVYAYYLKSEENTANADKQADKGTLLRFTQAKDSKEDSFSVPGLTKVDAEFDVFSTPAYNDHWVSNVYSRKEFLSTLEDTLGFTPKVDFNAGVVAAGEAQIESTVTGNTSPFSSSSTQAALKDQSQVYLPINNALSDAGHVHYFLEELGQGVQHVASKVKDLVGFVQSCNDYRQVTGEGFTFLNIPRSYYGVLSVDHLVSTADIPADFAQKVVEICEKKELVENSAVDLDLDKDGLGSILDGEEWSSEHRKVFEEKRDSVIEAVLNSRYKNMYSLLRDHVSEQTYMGIVRNKVLVDVQGEDLLYQIFTGCMLQRNAGEEAPFFEFIQRVCSECKDENGCPAKVKPGCGGFGIRNFLTLFLSIEVSKAFHDGAEAKRNGDEEGRMYAEKRVECFTRQLNDSNPILTEISDAMTEEGDCKQKMEAAEVAGDAAAASSWKEKMEACSARKVAGNLKLMECSAEYEAMMKSLRAGGK